VNLFSIIFGWEKTVFYDSTCGVDLFKAPNGRAFEQFESDSRSLHWLSFEKQEKTNNVEIRPSGEIMSVCGTHLGTVVNSTKGMGVVMLINLMCIAGRSSEEDISVFTNKTNSGNIEPYHHNNQSFDKYYIWVIVAVVLVFCLGFLACKSLTRSRMTQETNFVRFHNLEFKDRAQLFRGYANNSRQSGSQNQISVRNQ